MPNRRDFLKAAGMGGAVLAAGIGSPPLSAQGGVMPTVYSAKDFSRLIGTPGLSETLLKNHFTLYQGYVTNTNKLVEALAQMGKDGKLGTPEAAELRRRFGWEWDGMRLHEFYFENLGGKTPLDPAGKLGQALAAGFGTVDAWMKDFKAVGAMRGIGWVALVKDPLNGRLFDLWINEHDGGHLAGTKPVLIMDVFEHAYMIDYGLRKADYIEAFFKAVDWAAAEARLA
jgi:Fe-Mn family superoxide dismutase